MGNFVFIITHNGTKIAFRTEEDLNDYIAKNDMKRVHVTLIQYYKDKLMDKGESNESSE